MSAHQRNPASRAEIARGKAGQVARVVKPPVAETGQGAVVEIQAFERQGAQKLHFGSIIEGDGEAGTEESQAPGSLKARGQGDARLFDAVGQSRGLDRGPKIVRVLEQVGQAGEIEKSQGPSLHFIPRREVLGEPHQLRRELLRR